MDRDNLIEQFLKFYKGETAKEDLLSLTPFEHICYFYDWLIENGYANPEIDKRREKESEKYKIIYIAGPFRAENSWDMECNIRKAEELSLKVWKLNEEGYNVAVICPHTNTRFFQGACDDNVWIDGLLEILKRCDALITTEEWENSEGTKIERNLAHKLGIPIFDSVFDLQCWLDRS